MLSKEIRQKFLDFFQDKGHQVVASSPLVPHDDPTLLFVNAGMVQFKDVFTGKEKRPYKRATSSQKCVRAGGKHNDLENVGRTPRHHTFFEMLGNFSFGDYFKQEACAYALEFLTQVLKMDPRKFTITVFGGEEGLPADTEAEEIWKSLGIQEHQISRKGAEDNFWSMGDTGPCGPCTEIHYDRGQGQEEGDQNMEFWNLVFMQYDRQTNGTLIPLPTPSVDTGMGLERICTILNQLSSNYEGDLLCHLVEACAKKSLKKYQGSDSEDDVSMRVIADHSRATAFLIADGVLPSNEGRGYVLRRIMRRAIRHGERLGLHEVFFHDMCAQVIQQYQEIYPELKNARALIQKVVLQEEESFRRTLERGLELFEHSVQHLKSGDFLDGSLVFKLHETYGFPPDLTEVLAQEKELSIHWDTFHQAQKAHEKASSSSLGLSGTADIYKKLSEKLGFSHFEDTPWIKVEVLEILDNELILEPTPFYAESGGQIGDTGTLENKNSKIQILDTQKKAGLHLHRFKILSGTLKTGDHFEATVDWQRRSEIRRHHSATHLLHSALRKILGDHVTQKGSLVEPNRLRFDFSHFEPISSQQIINIENLVNSWILENQATQAEIMPIKEAQEKGAMALFGEKYGDQVRVMKIGSHSTELCGGTHISRTGEIGLFKIISEGPLAAGVRRVEALCGQAAIVYTQDEHRYLNHLCQVLNVTPQTLLDRVQNLMAELKKSRQQLETFHQKESSHQASLLIQKAKIIQNIQSICEILTDLDPKQLQSYSDELRRQLKSGLVVLGLRSGPEKCHILVALTSDLNQKLHAGKLITELAPIIGGKGGGRSDFAQAGGNKPELLETALQQVESLVKTQLSS